MSWPSARSNCWSAMTCSIVHKRQRSMSRVASASGMKSLGRISPRVGCRQRTKRLGARHLLAADMHLGLILQEHLAAIDRARQIALQRHRIDHRIDQRQVANHRRVVVARLDQRVLDLLGQADFVDRSRRAGGDADREIERDAARRRDRTARRPPSPASWRTGADRRDCRRRFRPRSSSGRPPRRRRRASARRCDRRCRTRRRSSARRRASRRSAA